MPQTPMPSEPKPAADSGPNPDKGVHDSSEHTQFTAPPRRLGTSQDFGDREVPHTEEAQERRAAANHEPASGSQAQNSGAPGHGNPRPSPEAKRAWNPD